MSTAMPAARSRSAPRAASGLGSAIAATTRATRAAITASVHGGVRPVWLQGSSVTYSVAPRRVVAAGARVGERRHLRVRLRRRARASLRR